MRIMLADEARFGRMESATAVLGADRNRARGSRPADTRIHLFVRRGRTQDGTCVYLIADFDTECFEAFLDVLARKFAWQDMPPVLDDPTIAPATLPFPTTSRSYIFRPTRRPQSEGESLGRNPREIFKNYALNPSTPARQTQAGHPLHRAHAKLVNPSPFSHISSTHSDIEVV